MSGLGAMLAGASRLEDGLALEIGEDWLQGRTAYGGLTSAIALAAARTVDPLLAPLRSAQFAMIGPMSGRVEARARILRKGRNATWVSAELTGEGGLCFTASFVFMHRIASAADVAGYAVPEGLVPLDQARPVPMKQAPAFLRHHFEARFALPKAALGEADLCWWVRLNDPAGLDPELEAVLVGDGLPTAVLPLLEMRAPISSMHWHVNMLDPAARDGDGWWLLRSTSRFARDGAASEEITQWSAGGVPAIAGLQSVAVFG